MCVLEFSCIDNKAHFVYHSCLSIFQWRYLHLGLRAAIFRCFPLLLAKNRKLVRSSSFPASQGNYFVSLILLLSCGAAGAARITPCHAHHVIAISSRRCAQYADNARNSRSGGSSVITLFFQH